MPASTPSLLLPSGTYSGNLATQGTQSPEESSARPTRLARSKADSQFQLSNGSRSRCRTCRRQLAGVAADFVILQFLETGPHHPERVLVVAQPEVKSVLLDPVADSRRVFRLLAPLPPSRPPIWKMVTSHGSVDRLSREVRSQAAAIAAHPPPTMAIPFASGPRAREPPVHRALLVPSVPREYQSSGSPVRRTWRRFSGAALRFGWSIRDRTRSNAFAITRPVGQLDVEIHPVGEVRRDPSPAAG